MKKFNLTRTFLLTLVGIFIWLNSNSQTGSPLLLNKESAENLMKQVFPEVIKEINDYTDYYKDANLQYPINIPGPDIQRRVCNSIIIGGYKRFTAWEWLINGIRRNPIQRITLPNNKNDTLYDFLVHSQCQMTNDSNEIQIDDTISLSIIRELKIAFSANLSKNNIVGADSLHLALAFNDSITTHFQNNSLTNIKCRIINQVYSPQCIISVQNNLQNLLPYNQALKAYISDNNFLICGVVGLYFEEYKFNSQSTFDMKSFVSAIVNANYSNPNVNPIANSISADINSKWKSEKTKYEKIVASFKINNPIFFPFKVKYFNSIIGGQSIIGDTGEDNPDNIHWFTLINILVVVGLIAIILFFVMRKKSKLNL